MIVGVAHGPAAHVPLRIPVLRAVDVLLVGIWPFLEPVRLFHVLMKTQRILLSFQLENSTVLKAAFGA